MRRFELHRDEDVSGVSGTGVVAEGVAFGDGPRDRIIWIRPMTQRMTLPDTQDGYCKALHPGRRCEWTLRMESAFRRGQVRKAFRMTHDLGAEKYWHWCDVPVSMPEVK